MLSTKLLWNLSQPSSRAVLARIPTALLLAAPSCPTPCDPMDCTPPGSSVRGILQARILEGVAISFSRGSSPHRDWTHVSYASCIGRRVLHLWATSQTAIALPNYSLLNFHVTVLARVYCMWRSSREFNACDCSRESLLHVMILSSLLHVMILARVYCMWRFSREFNVCDCSRESLMHVTVLGRVYCMWRFSREFNACDCSREDNACDDSRDGHGEKSL